MLAIIMFTIVIITLTVAAVIVKIPILFLGVFITSIGFLFSIFKYVEDAASQTNPVTQVLKIEALADQDGICPEEFLQHLEYMQSFGWLNVSRLDDETQKIFFIDRPSGENARKRFHSSKDAYQYLEEHYQDRNRRLHILHHWLNCEMDVKKHLIEDYFNLDIQDLCKKYLPDAELSKQAYLQNFLYLMDIFHKH